MAEDAAASTWTAGAAGASVRRARARPACASGQASVELLAGIPLLLGAGVICLQLLAVGYSSSLADGAVEAGAIALAEGRSAADAVAAALPGWADEAVRFEERGGRVTVHLEPPSLLRALSRELEVSSSAWVRRPR